MRTRKGVTAGVVLTVVAASQAHAGRVLCVHDVPSGEALALRAGPGPEFPVRDTLPAGTCGVRYIGHCRNEWCEFEHQGRAGYAHIRFIAVFEEEGSSGGGSCVARVAKGDTLRVRTGPGVRFEEFAGLPPDACGVEVIGKCAGDWCPIEWQGIRGWVNTRFLE